MMKEIQIGVIGATGKLGVPVVKYLIRFGYKVKLIVRDTEKARKLFGESESISMVKADLTDVQSLQLALTDVEYLYLNLSTLTVNLKEPFAPEREGIANILAAINKERIKQIIAISGLGAFDNVYKPNTFTFIPNIIRKQGHKLLKESGIPYTLLHCSWFADCFVVYRRKNTYSIIGSTQNPIYFTDCFSYSTHLSNAIGNVDAFYKEFPIQGKTAYTHPEAARKFLDIYSPETKVATLPAPLLKVLAVFSRQMKFIKHMSDYSFASKEEFLAEECGTYKILGEPANGLIEYAMKLKKENTYL